MNAPYDIVIPTIGRASLQRLLRSLDAASGPPPERIVVVDDRRGACTPLALGDIGAIAGRVTVIASGGRGPAAARNRGWRAASSPWIAFLDDDVTVDAAWCSDLQHDLDAAGDAAASFGRVRVPLPLDRRPTDWERNVAALERARWITADCALRRTALSAVGGFDERFRRAYREDSDLVLRLQQAGFPLAQGDRRVTHPVRAADAWVSVRMQAGNADDAVMDALHGAGWRARLDEPRGAFTRYAPIAASAAIAGAASLTWLVLTARFAWNRIAPGPRTPREIATMAVTSAAIPIAAVLHRMRGTLRSRRLRRTAAVLFDRDGTLIADTPVLGDPARVAAMPGAREAVRRLRGAGFALGVVTNQHAVARGDVTRDELDAVHRRIDADLGPFDVWAVCTHDVDDGCGCRKPQPGLVIDAARRLGVAPGACVVIGDILSDVLAARRAGARSVLVPNAATLREEIAQAPVVASDLAAAADLILRGAA